MVRIIERRLRKLEAETASRRRRTFVFGEVKPGEAKMQELLAAGVAHKDDLFIFTGVPQRDPSPYAVWDGDPADSAWERTPLTASRAGGEYGGEGKRFD